jgi:phospholipase C
LSSTLAFTAANATDGTNAVFDIVGSPGAKSSYIGADAKLHAVGDTAAGGLCGGASKGIAFTSPGGPSTFDISIPNPLNLPIQHVVVLMQENRSADSHFGALSTQGQPNYEPEPATPGNPDPTNPSGPAILPFHKTNYCDVADLDHSWNGTHQEIDGGAMDGFTAANAVPADPTGHRAMGYYDQTDLPFYYKLYSTFATGDRYFASAPTQTFPNRLYLYAATSFGHIRNDVIESSQKSIFELLDSRSIPWHIYASGNQSYGSLFFSYVQHHAAGHVFPISQYFTDLNNNALPSVTFIDPGIDDNPQTENDEHPPADVQLGQKYVADAINALIASPEWASSAFFLTYDEHGGFYDHVAPPAAPKPDNIAPMLQPGDAPGAFDIYGVRVPEVTVSPYAKPAFVSHVVHDHTSITRFIEDRFGLPNMTNRDLNADPMMEMFDFSTPALLNPPSMPAATIDAGQLATCEQ